MIYDDQKRLTFGDWVDKFFAVALIAVISFGVSKIDQISEEISAINIKMATVIERTSNQKDKIDDLELRILNIEHRLNQ